MASRSRRQRQSRCVNGWGLPDMEWRQITELPAYEVSESGDVRRRSAGRTRKAGHIPKGHISHGYRHFKLMCPDGTKQVFRAHALVCTAWHGPRPSSHHQVAHGDGNGLNNHHTNLRWATSAENHADRKRHGTDPIGSRNGRAVLSETDVRAIRLRLTGRYGEIAALAREYGVSHSAMLSICRGRHWLHVGT